MNSLVLNTEIKTEQVVHTEDIHSTLVSQKISDLKNGKIPVYLLQKFPCSK